MVITSRTYTTLFASDDASPNTGGLIRLPLSVVPHYERRCEVTGAIVPTSNKPLFRSNLWSSDEHDRFLHGLELFPNGPWKEVAKIVGTKSTRQTMTHAQKYRQKIERHLQAKTKEPTEKARRRNLGQTGNSGARGCSQPGTGRPAAMTFFDELVTCCTVDEPRPVRVASSPKDVYSDVFDTSFLDQEFDALLTSLESQPQQGRVQFYGEFA